MHLPKKTTLAATLFVTGGFAWLGYHFPIPARARNTAATLQLPAAAVSAQPSRIQSPPRPPPTAETEAGTGHEAEQTRLTALERELSNTLAAVDQHKLLAQAYAADLSDQAANHTGTSIFKNIQEAGLFIAAINQKSLAYVRLAEKFPPPPPGSPEAAELDRLLNEITRDAAAVVQDPLFMAELKSADPVRNALVQAAYVGPSLGLDSSQQTLLTARLTQAYQEGRDRKLWLKERPDGDDTAWRTAREELNARTVADIKSRLTPAQLDVYSLLGYDDLVFNFTLGVVKK